MNPITYFSCAAAHEISPMSWLLLRLPRLRGLGAALASRPFC